MDIEDLNGKNLGGRYRLLELLGVGGMGAVYRAYDTVLERDVAVKVLSPRLASEQNYVERFAREAKIAASLEHPNIVPVYDYGTENGLCYIVMRLLMGGSLEMQLKPGQALPTLQHIASLLQLLASALDYAHEQGVIHRDVKASNVMFDSRAVPFLGDFGIAKLMDTAHPLTDPGVAMGTHSHMAPEQWRGEELTPAVDQYALGVVIYTLVAGSMPFEAPTPYGLMFKHLHEKPPTPQQSRPDLPQTINPVLNKALAKKPQERYPTLTDYARAFKQAVDGAKPQPVVFAPAPMPKVDESRSANPFSEELDGPTTPAPLPSRPAARGRRIWVVLSLIILSLSLGFGLMCLPDRCIAPPAATPVVTAEKDAPGEVSAQNTATSTVSSTPSDTPSPTVTDTPTFTPSSSATQTNTNTPTSTRTLTSSPTSTASPTLTRTAIPTSTYTMTPIPTVTPGTTTLNGTLTPGIPNQQAFVLQNGSSITIRVVAHQFDPYLILRDANGNTVAENDDCGTISRSCITVTLTVNGVYTVIVDSFDRQSGGAYTMDITVVYPPTATPTKTPIPTGAATGNSATATPENTCPPGLLTIRVSDNRESINIRRNPGTDSVRVGLAFAAECLGVDGQSADGEWLHIHTLSGRSGWVLASLTDITEEELESLPVIEG